MVAPGISVQSFRRWKEMTNRTDVGRHHSRAFKRSFLLVWSGEHEGGKEANKEQDANGCDESARFGTTAAVYHGSATDRHAKAWTPNLAAWCPRFSVFFIRGWRKA